MYFDTGYCERENTLLNKCKHLKMTLIHFKKRFYEKYILALNERLQHEVKKTNNHLILKITSIISLKEDKSRNKWRKAKIIKLSNGNDNLVQGVERFTTQELKERQKKLGDFLK